jgi:hypothetical protein
MKRRKMLPMSRSDLEKLPTKQLLARLKRLHQCEQSLALSDQDIENYAASDFIEFKESSSWITEYNNLKEILAKREHIPKD